MTDAVIVFAKAPVPGKAKTRLGAGIGDEAAAAFAAAFIADVCATVSTLDLHAVLAWAGEEGHPAFDVARAAGFEFREQPDGDLGARLDLVIRDVAAHSDRVFVIGSDSPTLHGLHFDEARRSLQTHDVVIGPSFDGGYYLLGVRSEWFLAQAGEARHPLFAGIDWSTSSVLSQTLRRCRQVGALCDLIRFCYDVDTPEDLKLLGTHLLDHLRPSGLDVAQNTAILLSNYSK